MLKNQFQFIKVSFVHNNIHVCNTITARTTAVYQIDNNIVLDVDKISSNLFSLTVARYGRFDHEHWCTHKVSTFALLSSHCEFIHETTPFKA